MKQFGCYTILLDIDFFKGTVNKGDIFIYNAQGQLMAKYTVLGDTLRLDFLPIYEGTRRLGIYEPEGVEWVVGSGKLSLLPHNYVLPCLNCPLQLTKVRRYALKPTRKYELTDHLGNVRVVIADQRMAVPDSSGQVVAYYKPKVVGIYDYYPYGWVKIRTAAYSFGANGGSLMEGWDSSGGMYYTLFRMLDSRVGRWWGVEPRWEEYVEVSGYGVHVGNPVVLVDWFGTDTVWILQKNGKLQRYVESEGEDVFIVVGEGGEEVGRLVLPEHSLLRVERWSRRDLRRVPWLYRSLFGGEDGEYFEGKDNDRSRYVYIYRLRGDDVARRLFEFLADHTEVEWGLWGVGEEGSGGLNFLTTTGLKRREYGGAVLYWYQLRYGYNLRFHIHSHSQNPFPSEKDIRFKESVLRDIRLRYRFKYGFVPQPRFEVFIPSSYLLRDKLTGEMSRVLDYTQIMVLDWERIPAEVRRRYEISPTSGQVIISP